MGAQRGKDCVPDVGRTPPHLRCTKSMGRVHWSGRSGLSSVAMAYLLPCSAGGDRIRIYWLALSGNDCNGIRAGGPGQRLPARARARAVPKAPAEHSGGSWADHRTGRQRRRDRQRGCWAIGAYAKINSAGEWIDRTQTVSLNDLFDRMSTQELEAYAQTWALPEWFRATAGTSEYSHLNLGVDTHRPKRQA